MCLENAKDACYDTAFLLLILFRVLRFTGRRDGSFDVSTILRFIVEDGTYPPLVGFFTR